MNMNLTKRPRLALCGIVAVACLTASVALGASRSQQATELTVWDWGSPSPASMKELDTAFMKLNPGITIKRVHQPFNSYFTLLRTATATRKGPDIVENYASPAVFDYARALLPLTSYRTAAQKKDLVGWNLVSSSLSASGTPYAMPWGGQGIVMYYNKRLFKKAGLDPNKPPKTWKQFLAACEALKNAGIVPIAEGWKDGYGAEWWIDTLSSQYMSPSELATVGTKQNWRSPAVRKSLELLVDLSDKGYFTPDAEGIPLFPDTLNNFGAEKGAMAIGLAANCCNYQEFRKAKVGKNLGVMEPPLVPGGKWATQKLNYGPGLSWAITRWAKDPAAAYKFLTFLGTPAAQKMAFKSSTVFPNNVKTRAVTSDPIGAKILAWVATKPTYLGIMTLMRAPTEATLDKLVPQIMTKKVSIEDALKQIQATADKQPKIPTK